MREIKIRYRAQNIRTKEILTCVLSLIDIEIQHFEPEFLNNLDWTILSRDLWTGLHDKNGKEIYEGDLVRWKSYFVGVPWAVGKVYFQGGSFYVGGNESELWDVVDNKFGEVIGTIYDEVKG